jgi:hypothetical protein
VVTIFRYLTKAGRVVAEPKKRVESTVVVDEEATA